MKILLSEYRIQGSGHRKSCPLPPVPCTLLVALLLATFLIVSMAQAEPDWKEHGSTHFIICHTGDENRAKGIADKAERYYKNIAVDLGYPRYSDFWMWDDRVRVYLYPDKESYLREAEAQEWSEGTADYKKKEIYSFVDSQDFEDSVLPHEMAHLIFREFVGFTGEIPMWLDEGVAQWAEEAKRSEMKAMVKKYYKDEKLLMFSDMVKLDLSYIGSKENKVRVHMKPSRAVDGKPIVLIISTDELLTTYYLQSVSLIGFLVEKYGSQKFAELCRQLRDGKEVEDALRVSYPAVITSMDVLSDKWREYISKL
ncbi:hypothetical protein ACFL0T_02735 [Candidatus Omnitrophota bacterium]